MTRMFAYCHDCDLKYEWIEGERDDTEFWYEHHEHGKYTGWADNPDGRIHAMVFGAPI